MKRLFLIALLISFLPAGSLLFARNNAKPVELGKIDWIREFDEALEKVKETGKPMLLLFQEVPG